MNVNDVLCVGAEPIALLDYVAVECPDPDMFDSLGKGLYEGAKRSRIAIPGGEIAQIREMVHGIRKDYGFDLVGTCVGIVPLNNILTGKDVTVGDLVVGLRSSGIHSNGLTLARSVFFNRMGWQPDHPVDELGKTIGEELLEPTKIYVEEIMAMKKSGLKIKGLAHITSDGFLNLSRCDAEVGFVLIDLPEPQPIFRLIQKLGELDDKEMFFTYNMGIGFCVIIAKEHAKAV